jgi:hypothetical protein
VQLILVISDNCQEVSAPAVTWRVTCNTRPTQPVLNVQGGSTQIFFNGVSFPRVTIDGSSQDSDTLTYDWSINNLDITGSQIAALQVDYGTSGVTKNQLSFTPPPSTIQTTSTYNIIATAFDGCSLSPAGQISITLNCNGSLTARTDGDKSLNYDYTQSTFPETTFSGASSVWPYASVAASRKVWSWTTLYFDSPTSATGSPIGSGVSGASTDTYAIRPTRVGTYQIKLSIDDGCRTSSVTVNLRTLCTVSAVATLAQAVLQVEFNSYLSTAGAPRCLLQTRPRQQQQQHEPLIKTEYSESSCVVNVPCLL